MADLVRVERRGQFQVYSLNTTVFQDLLTEIMGWLGGMDGSLGNIETTEAHDVKTDSKIDNDEHEEETYGTL